MPSIAESVVAPLLGKTQKNGDSGASLDIIDIRGEHVEINLKDEVTSMLNPGKGPRRLPTMLLYSEKGLQLFEDVCGPN